MVFDNQTVNETTLETKVTGRCGRWSGTFGRFLASPVRRAILLYMETNFPLRSFGRRRRGHELADSLEKRMDARVMTFDLVFEFGQLVG